MPIEGYLESVEAQQVCGWAYDTDNPDRHIDVELFCGGQVIGRFSADFYRRDLEAAAIGRGDHAFVFNADAPIGGLACGAQPGAGCGAGTGSECPGEKPGHGRFAHCELLELDGVEPMRLATSLSTTRPQRTGAVPVRSCLWM